MNTLGDRLRMARDRKGYTQVKVKSRTNINNKTLSGYEKNVSEPDTSTLVTLADLYGVSYKWLLSGKGEMTESESISKDEKDIAKRIEEFKRDITSVDGLNFSGEPMSEDAKESLVEAMDHVFRQTQRINKKYIPKRHRDSDDK